MPAGAEGMVPVPDRAPGSARLAAGGGADLKTALTERSASRTTSHAAGPEQSPLHPAKVAPASGEAVRTSRVPAMAGYVQRPLHAVAPETATDPGPSSERVNWC